MTKEIKCPNCKSKKVKTTTKGAVVNGAINVAGSLAGYFVNNFIGFHTNAGGVAKSALKSFVPKEFECTDCDCLFSVEFNMNQEVVSTKVKMLPAPYEIIQKEKDAYIKELEDSISYKKAIFFGVCCIALFIYCWNAPLIYKVWREATWLQDAGYYDDCHYSWFFWAFLCLVSFICALACKSSADNKKNEVKIAKAQTLIEFKHSHPILFAKYPDYR